MKESGQFNVLKQLFEGLSKQEQENFLASLIKPSPRAVIQPRKFQKCPRCGGTHFVKNGTRRGIQRYICRDCHKSFDDQTGTILSGSLKPLSLWQKYVDCMMEKMPLRRCAAVCGIDLTTAFTWRHKILDALQKMQDQVNCQFRQGIIRR